MSDMLFVNFELRDRYGDVGHHLLVQDAPSFNQKYMILIDYLLIFAFVYISDKCIFSLISMFWPFPGVLVPAMTSASKNQYRGPRFRVELLRLDAVDIWSKVFSWRTDNSCPQRFLRQKPKKPDQFAYIFLGTDFLREFPLVVIYR
jgi:hypothetical protein